MAPPTNPADKIYSYRMLGSMLTVSDHESYGHRPSAAIPLGHPTSLLHIQLLNTQEFEGYNQDGRLQQEGFPHYSQYINTLGRATACALKQKT